MMSCFLYFSLFPAATGGRAGGKHSALREPPAGQRCAGLVLRGQTHGHGASL